MPAGGGAGAAPGSSAASPPPAAAAREESAFFQTARATTTNPAVPQTPNRTKAPRQPSRRPTWLFFLARGLLPARDVVCLFALFGSGKTSRTGISLSSCGGGTRSGAVVTPVEGGDTPGVLGRRVF